MPGGKIGKTLLEQIADLVEREPQNNDVIFSVGPEKIKVSGVKIILKAASPVFEREFKENWDSAIMEDGKGIPFPGIDPSIFKLFIKLTMSDTWSVDALNKLNVPQTTMLSLLGLCRRFQITKAIPNLEEAAHGFIRDFADFKDTREFLEMSRENLETIFSCEQIPLNEMEIFVCALRWAKHQCKVKKIELTCKNFREVLGSCFFEIRFATMKLMEFIKLSTSKNNMFLFSRREVVAICGLITTDDEGERVKYEKEGVPIKTNPRSSFGCSVLRLPKQFVIDSEYSFECDGRRSENWFQVNQKIRLHGVGFLGPMDGDTEYDVRVRIKTFSPSCVFDSGPLTKSILARRGRIFHFLFDEPITIEPHSFSDSWMNGNCISYRLKGASNIPQYTQSDLKLIRFGSTDPFPSLEETVQVSSRIEFYLDEQWSMSPLAEFLFK